MGQRTLVMEDIEDVEAYLTAWRLNNSPFQAFRAEDGQEKMVAVELIQQVLRGDQRTELDCLRDRGQLDGALLAGRVQNSTESSTPSTGSTEPPS